MHFRLLYFVTCVLSQCFSSAQRLVSRGKTITASSQLADWFFSRAVDGNTDRGASTCLCCAATRQQYEPWYKLDLGQQYKIYSISVLGRGGAGDKNGGYGQTLKNMQIKLGTTRLNGQEITHYTGNDYTYDYTLPTPQGGRYLTLTLLKTKQFFVICELSVYADCIDGRYGSDCQEICGKCENNDTCNKGDGTCLRCRTGYKPPLCQENAEIKAQSPELKSYQLATAIVGTVAGVVIIGNVVAAICYMTRHRRKHRERPIQSQPVISNLYEMANRGAFGTEHQYGQTAPAYEVPEEPYEIPK